MKSNIENDYDSYEWETKKCKEAIERLSLRQQTYAKGESQSLSRF